MITNQDTHQTLATVANQQIDRATAKNSEELLVQSNFQQNAASLLGIQEAERKRIAIDLHDGIGQSLTLIRLALDNVTDLLATDAFVEAEMSLQQLKVKVQDALAELRHVATGLRPSMLDDLGILATLSWYFRELALARHCIEIQTHILVEESDIPVPLKITIFRILQEAVCNIIKHAKADHIRVTLMRVSDSLHLVVEDNGQGFDLSLQDKYCSLNTSFGLVSMQERAEFSGGSYRIESVVGKGTRISVSWQCI